MTGTSDYLNMFLELILPADTFTQETKWLHELVLKHVRLDRCNLLSVVSPWKFAGSLSIFIIEVHSEKQAQETQLHFDWMERWKLSLIRHPLCFPLKNHNIHSDNSRQQQAVFGSASAMLQV